MWSNGHQYRGEESNDAFQMSPCLTASSGLLTPPNSYSIDARRNSTASLQSSLGPTTPVYGRNPFSDHGFTNVPSIEPCQDHPMDALSMGYSFKTPGQEGASYENWSTVPQPNSLDHTMLMRMSENFVSHPGLVQSSMATYAGIENQASPIPVSCASSFSGGPYTGYHHGHMQSEADHAHTGEGIWSYQYALANMPAGPTMAPNEALLGSEYGQVDAGNPDTDMGPYEDVDVPLTPSPQDILVKQEDAESSADDRRIRRSIWVSSTGGKSVKKEGQTSLTKKKSRKSRSKAITRLHGDRFDLWLDDDVEQIPGTKKWRRNGDSTSGKPQVCEIAVNGQPCGRKFRRQEHLHRHMKTHSGRKDFVCQLCLTQFNRNDNCWEHYWTHVHRPGKKNGRNKKHSLRRVLTYITDPKHAEKLYNKWRKEVGYEYDANSDSQAQDEEHVEEEAASSSTATDDDGPDSSPLKQEKYKIRSKL